MFIYENIRLVIIAVLMVYFIGSFNYMISDKFNHENDEKSESTFIDVFDFRDHHMRDRLIISCYYSLTMLSTVGYGDYYPISEREMVFGSFVMLTGVAFFSYIMGVLVEISSTYS